MYWIALKLDPTHPETLFNLAATYFELQDYAKAINYYTLLTQMMDKPDYKVFYNLAMCLEKIGDLSNAQINYQLVFAL